MVSAISYQILVTRCPPANRPSSFPILQPVSHLWRWCWYPDPDTVSDKLIYAAQLIISAWCKVTYMYCAQCTHIPSKLHNNMVQQHTVYINPLRVLCSGDGVHNTADWGLSGDGGGGSQWAEERISHGYVRTATHLNCQRESRDMARVAPQHFHNPPRLYPRPHPCPSSNLLLLIRATMTRFDDPNSSHRLFILPEVLQLIFSH